MSLRRVLVEGTDDMHVVHHVASKLGLEIDLPSGFVPNVSNVSDLLEATTAEIFNAVAGARLAIVLDADQDPAQR